MSITKEAVLETLQAVAKDNPKGTRALNYSVEGAERLGYDATTPLCIVGHAVSRLRGLHGLRSITEGNILDTEYYPDTVNYTLRQLGFEAEAVNLLAEAQARQDRGERWDELVGLLTRQHKLAKV